MIHFHSIGFLQKLGRLTIDDVFPEEDPRGGDESAEAEEKSQKEPNASSSDSQASGGVGFAAKLAVRYGVYPASRVARLERVRLKNGRKMNCLT